MQFSKKKKKKIPVISAFKSHLIPHSKAGLIAYCLDDSEKLLKGLLFPPYFSTAAKVNLKTQPYGLVKWLSG